MSDQISEKLKSKITCFLKSYISQILGQIIFSSSVLDYTNDDAAKNATICSFIFSIIALVYLGFLLACLFFKPQYLNLGAIIILEGLVELLFLISLFAISAIVAKWPCGASGDLTDIIYSLDFSSNPCKTVKAAVFAFIGLYTVFYGFSLISVVYYLPPLLKVDRTTLFKILEERDFNVTNGGSKDTTAKFNEEKVVSIEEVSSATVAAAATTTTAVLEETAK